MSGVRRLGILVLALVAPLAVAAGVAVVGAANVDLRDPAAAVELLRHGHDIKRDGRHVQRMRHSYRVIGAAELQEE